MGFDNIDTEVFVACGRSCSICHKFCGTKMELHHIKQKADGGEDSWDNCIPLCFDCHADVKAYNPKHPKGKKYTEKELKAHRDNWYNKVANSSAFYPYEDYLKLDMDVYVSLDKYLPYDVMQIVKEIEFNTMKYKLDTFRPLEVYVEECVNPHLQYMDFDMEIAKMALRDSIKHYFRESSPVIFADDGEHCMIPKDWKYKNDETAIIYYSAVENLNNATTDIWKKYCDYVVMAKRKKLCEVEECMELDRHLFGKLREMLPESFIFQMKKQHFGNTFSGELFSIVDEFLYKAKLPSFEFLNADVEALCSRLKSYLEQFADWVCGKTFSDYISDKKYYSMKKDEAYLNSQSYNDDILEIHDIVDNIYNVYCEIIRTGRRKYKIM